MYTHVRKAALFYLPSISRVELDTPAYAATVATPISKLMTSKADWSRLVVTRAFVSSEMK